MEPLATPKDAQPHGPLDMPPRRGGSLDRRQLLGMLSLAGVNWLTPLAELLVRDADKVPGSEPCAIADLHLARRGTQPVGDIRSSSRQIDRRRHDRDRHVAAWRADCLSLPETGRAIAPGGACAFAGQQRGRSRAGNIPAENRLSHAAFDRASNAWRDLLPSIAARIHRHSAAHFDPARTMAGPRRILGESIRPLQDRRPGRQSARYRFAGLG